MTAETIKTDLQNDLYKITAKQNAELRVQKSDFLEKTKLLERLLAECHAELVVYDPNTEVGERVENYFAGNGAILYSELEIPEEKPVSQVGTEKPADCLSNLIVPIGYELSVEDGGDGLCVLILKNSLNHRLGVLHMGSSPLGLTDDEILSIQAKIDEVAE